jgi:hypothetical protein
MRYAIFSVIPKECSVPIRAFYHILQSPGEQRKNFARFRLSKFPLESSTRSVILLGRK